MSSMLQQWGWCHSHPNTQTLVVPAKPCPHKAPSLLRLNLSTAHHVSPAPKSLKMDSSVDAAHPWSCLGTWWHWGIRSTHHLPPHLEPHRKGAVLELGEDGSGTEEEPFFPSEAAEAFRTPQLSTPRCLCLLKTSSWVRDGPHVHPAGTEGQDGRTVFPGLCLYMPRLCRPYKNC